MKEQKDKPHPLYTRWGEKLDRDCPLPEHPTPQFRRDNWDNLNGVWQYAFRSDAGSIPTVWDGEIVVPFSPESLLSGVGRQLNPREALWYLRTFTVDRSRGARIVLHFGAVDQKCTVFVGSTEVGGFNGGYWPFSIDITDAVTDGDNTLAVCVFDDSDEGIHAYGKQKLEHGGIWYSPQSGIWQTVWLEYLPACAVESLKITPMFDQQCVAFDAVFSDGKDHPFTVTILDNDGPVAIKTFRTRRGLFDFPKFHAWTPDDPFLYDVVVESGDDRVYSYFGMRKFHIGFHENGTRCFFLNNRPLFLTGLLDQGYWSDGMLTPPADEAMVYDIATLKEMGYNLLRKHIKIELLRWYYHCDRIGMLVFQDFVNGGGPYKRMVIDYLPFIGIHLNDRHYRLFARQDKLGRDQYITDLHRTVDLLYNTVSVCTWVPFNEGWGQFDANAVTETIRVKDQSRPVDHASGRHDQHGGDYKSEHVYYKKYRMKPDFFDRAVIISEFGGYSCPAPGHMSTDKLFGYEMYDSPAALTDAYCALYNRDVFPYVTKGLSGTVYTQVSDVEEEINGVFTYDRAVVKLDADRVRAVNEALKKALDD